MTLHPVGPAVLVLVLALSGCAGVGVAATGPSSGSSTSATAGPSGSPSVSASAPGEGPLSGRTVVVDPGHQLGNSRFPRETGRLVPAGGFRKPCNTTGTATDGGYPEATFAWQVSQVVVRRLEALGARVILTRDRNSTRLWGPCVDVRGRAGNRAGADLKLSIHGDGSYAAGAHGFHVIRPPDRAPWTDDIARPSRRLALGVRRELRDAGFPYATYTAGGDGLDVRRDLGTLNLSDVPTVLVELGNMRSRVDAAVMTRRAGRARYAAALVKAVRGFLG
ncbi:N-acetylmuramoyl-L-alanine amidase family protein [Nocardioides rubriscoriae]|uniref:N-acetylmuramoyl-L-alanine amidase family protein n=1 Tax=Nocardioides rubriscoriae TaxID=642762 RepID=UPI0011DFA14C|nr:N-acetylmuramoyl-L-alanine amidase [Nocardioides rubriscoriae]